MYNINKSCVIYQTCGKSPGLWTLYEVIVLQTLWNVDQPCKMYRTGGLYKVLWPLYIIEQRRKKCTILTTLSKITRTYSLYMVLRPLHNINNRFKNLPGLRTLYGLATFVQYWPAFWNFTGLMDFIRSVVHCIISASLTMSRLAAHQASGDNKRGAKKLSFKSPVKING